MSKKKPVLTIDVLTLFTDMFAGPLSESLLGRAQKAGLIQIRLHALRTWSEDKKHLKVDDRPFGGGAGMVIRPEPVFRALKALGAMKKSKRRPWVIYLSPQGKVLNQALAHQLKKRSHVILICGHYEGMDERVMRWVDQEVSIGDFVLTGGELPAMVLIDAVCRLVPGVVGDPASIRDESFSEGLLDYPVYTRPRVWRGMKVPDVLVSGNHAAIHKWRKYEAVKQTLRKRPELVGELGTKI